MIEKQSYRIAEFCLAHGVGRSKVYEEIAAKRLKIIKFGRMTLISKEAAHEWLRLYEEGALIAGVNPK